MWSIRIVYVQVNLLNPVVSGKWYPRVSPSSLVYLPQDTMHPLSALSHTYCLNPDKNHLVFHQMLSKVHVCSIRSGQMYNKLLIFLDHPRNKFQEDVSIYEKC